MGVTTPAHMQAGTSAQRTASEVSHDPFFQLLSACSSSASSSTSVGAEHDCAIVQASISFLSHSSEEQSGAMPAEGCCSGEWREW